MNFASATDQRCKRARVLFGAQLYNLVLVLYLGGGGGGGSGAAVHKTVMIVHQSQSRTGLCYCVNVKSFLK